MNCKTVLAQLKSWGSAQTRKTYARHGVGPEMFGVSYANLYRLRKQIKTDHALALELWASGNHDARVLATMIADPAAVDGKLAEAWLKDVDNAAITDAMSGVVAHSPVARQKAAKWTTSSKEWIGRAGWNIVARLALDENDLDDKYFAAVLPIIEHTIHSRPNRTRDAMNSVVIAIGVRNPRLSKRALAAARRIGKVHVDQGQTCCKTRDATEYIQKTLAHRRMAQRRARVAAK